MSFTKSFIAFFLLFSTVLILNCQREIKNKYGSAESFMNYSWDELSKISIEATDEVTLKESGIFSLPIDSLTQNPIIYPVYYDDGENHFFSHFNIITNSLDLYDLKSKKRIKRFYYPSDGPMAISKKSFPYIKSMDSIFVWTYNPPMAFLIDSTGQQIGAYNFNGHVENINMNMVQPFFEINNNIIMAYQPPYYNSMLKDSSNFLIYNLDSRNTKKKFSRTASFSFKFSSKRSRRYTKALLGS